MRLLIIGNSNTGDQRSPGVLPPNAFQPFRRRCRLLGHFDDVANRIIIDIGIDGLRRLAIAAVENFAAPAELSGYRYLPRLIPGGGLDGTQ